MNCFCCEPDYIEIDDSENTSITSINLIDKIAVKPHYIIHNLEEGTRQFCLLCNQRLTYKLVFCGKCQHTIGHVECAKKWLKNEENPRCPKCKK